MKTLPVNRNIRLSTARRQLGVSLLVVMVLLIVMSVLGIAVLRSAGMQERMSANLRDRNDALQAAEDGLRVAQQTVLAGTYNAMWNGSTTFAAIRTTATTTCAGNGVCDRSLTGDTEKSLVPTKPLTWTPIKAGDTTGPRYGYIVEYLGLGKGESNEVQQVCNTTAAPAYLCKRPMFRVTSFGRGRGVAQVVLQANVISQSP